MFQSPLNGLEQGLLHPRRRGVVKGGKSARAPSFPVCPQVSSAELSPLSTSSGSSLHIDSWHLLIAMLCSRELRAANLTSNNPINQHYIPQFHQRYFQDETSDQRGRLWAYDPDSPNTKPRARAIRRTASSDDLYTADWLPEPYKVEHAFGVQETQARELIEVLIQGTRALTRLEWLKLKEYIAALIVRNPAHIADLKKSIETTALAPIREIAWQAIQRLGIQLGEQVTESEFDKVFSQLDLKDFADPAILDNQDWEFHALEALRQDLPQYFVWLMGMCGMVYGSHPDEPPFLLTDPLATVLTLDKELGAIVFVPLTPRNILVFSEDAEKCFAALERVSIPHIQVSRSTGPVYSHLKKDTLNDLLVSYQTKPERTDSDD